ncbi:prohibitin family protein [Alkalihalobacillus sp. AL-G]|uniref:prohibitin family protein n=1 Tax=Alkalihalobacillus sp. AL-G TaxID=2926399 RepID=UPI002729DB3F|nr:prohibitin family protein [Alkalihalobacillus sp. AL-G]WLD92543.1 prohibitin family protein [Alkalihalobacillus sp. AL-G]
MEIVEKTEKKPTNNRKLIGGIIVGVALVLFVAIGSLFIEKIPNGYVGVVYSPNGGVQDETLGQGWHIVGLFDKVTRYPVRMQTVEYDNIQVATSDGKNITMDFAYNYSIQPDKVVALFNKFGPVEVGEIESTYLRTRLWDAGRKAIAKYSVIDTYGQKSAAAGLEIQKIFFEDVGELGFVIDDLTLGVPKPDKATQEAIDARVRASQELERKQTELKIAEAEAKKKVIEAQATADYNKIIRESMTPEVIQYMWIQKWDGQMPKATGTGNLIQIPIGDDPVKANQ